MRKFFIRFCFVSIFLGVFFLSIFTSNATYRQSRISFVSGLTSTLDIDFNKLEFSTEHFVDATNKATLQLSEFQLTDNRYYYEYDVLLLAKSQKLFDDFKLLHKQYLDVSGVSLKDLHDFNEKLDEYYYITGHLLNNSNIDTLLYLIN